jgi:hypothetical protein
MAITTRRYLSRIAWLIVIVSVLFVAVGWGISQLYALPRKWTRAIVPISSGTGTMELD